jgi:Ca2+-binding RTX toxin-like protein
LKDYKSTDEYTVNIKVDGINVEHELNPLTKPINANTSIANTTVNPLTLELNASLPGLIDFVDETKLTTQSLDDDSIKAGVTLNAGVLKIPANTGTSSVVLSIPILPDQVTLEKDEGIKLTLSLPTPTPTNYIVGDASTALMTIIDISDISPVLTSGADILFGTYGDTSFTSELLTLNAGDSVIDSSTTDKDKIKITTNFPLFTATATPTITNIETINLTALNNLDMDMTKITGVQNFNSINSTATIKLTKIADAKMALGLSGSNINTINANYSSIAAPTATADKLTVNLDAAIDANVTVNSGFEYAELNVVNDSTLRLFDVQLKPITGILTISGTGKLTVWDNALEVLGATPNGVNNIELINTSRMQFGDIGTLVVSGTPPVQSAIQTALLSTFKAPTNTGGIVTGTVQGALKGLTMQLGNGPDNVTIVDNATAPIQASPVPAFNDIRLGADDDKLDFTRSSNGNTYISGGEGNDVISIHNATSLDTIGSVGTSDILDTIDGGNGSDALSLDTTVNDVFLNKIISGIETLKVTGKNDVTLAANIVPTIIDVDDAVTAIATAAGAAASAAAAKAVVAASSASAAIKAAVATDLTLTTAALVAAAVINAQKSVVTFNTGYTQATTVKLGAEDSVVNSANVNLTINTTAANMIYDGDITITGGTGTDTLNLTADNSTVVFNSIITNLDKVVIVDGGDVTSGTVTAGKTVSLDLGAYDTALTIDASALDAGTPNATTPANLDNDETLTVSGALATKALNITGGAGRDTITGGTLNDVINAGAGDDSINGTAGGNDRIDAGAGNDTINMGNQLTSADTIDGGAGNDTLIFTSPLLNSLTNISGIETLVASGIVSIPSSLSFNTIDLSYGSNNDTLTFAQGYLSTTTVLADSGDSVTNTANTTLNVNFTAADLVTVIGGTRVDTLTITADNGTVDIKNVTKFSGIDNIIIVDNNVAGKTVTLDLSNYATAIRIDASSLDAGTPNSITPSTLDNDETLTIVGTSNAPLTVTGGDGADTLIGSGSSNVGDSLVGGAGNDLFKMSTNLTYLDTIFGGDGSDKLETSGVVNDSQFKNIDGIENLTLTDTATLGAIFNKAFVSNSNISVASNKKVDATFTTSGYIFTASTTNDITGGSGNDTFSFAGVNQLTANDIINGTSGDDDTIRLDNSTGVVTAIIDLDKVTNMDNVTIFNGDGGNAATTQNINLTFDLVTLTTVQTIKVGAAVITDTHDALIMTNSAGSSTTTFNITGGAGNDVLMGSNGADTLTGGSGADTLTGGSGADIFRFDLLANISNAAGLNVDTISDFLTGTDKVNFGTAGSAMSATIKGIALQPGITTAATFAANIPDATAVNSISDVYAAILANVGFNSSNFLGSTNSVSGIIAKTITFATGTLAGQYLVVNDSAPGFAYADDIVIKVVGTIAANDLTFTV